MTLMMPNELVEKLADLLVDNLVDTRRVVLIDEQDSRSDLRLSAFIGG